jgi:hypothetical protein
VVVRKTDDARKRRRPEEWKDDTHPVRAGPRVLQNSESPGLVRKTAGVVLPVPHGIGHRFPE